MSINILLIRGTRFVFLPSLVLCYNEDPAEGLIKGRQPPAESNTLMSIQHPHLVFPSENDFPSENLDVAGVKILWALSVII